MKGEIIIMFSLMLISVIEGFFSLPVMNRFLKIILIELVIDLIFNVGAFLVISYEKNMGYPMNNIWVHNIRMFVETSLLILAANQVKLNKKIRILNVSLYMVFVLVYIFYVYQYGMLVYFTFADVTECITMTVVYLTVLYSLVLNSDLQWWKNPSIYISIGLLFYFSGSVPYFSMSDFLHDHHPQIDKLLFYIINSFLAYTRYLLLGTGFLILLLNKRKTATINNTENKLNE